jgi:hypothetical protein
MHYLNSPLLRFPARLLRAFLLRGVVLWLLTRIMGTAVLAAATSSPSGGFFFAAWVIGMTASLALIDLHRRRELTLLHNLGIDTSRVVLISTTPAIVFEGILVMLLP